MSLIADLREVLTPSQTRRLLGAQLISVAMALSTVTGIAAIGPFFAVLGEPGLIDRNAWLHWLYDRGGFADHRGYVVALGIAFIVVMLIANAVNALGSIAMNRLALRIGTELQATLFEEYLSRRYAFHTRTSGTALFDSIIHEAARVSNGILQNLLVFVTNLITAALILLSVLIFNRTLSIALLACLAGGYGLVYLAARSRLLHLGQSHTRAWSERSRLVKETFAGIREVILLGNREVFQDAFRRRSEEISRIVAHIHAVGQIPRNLLECLAVMALVAAALAAGAHGESGAGRWLGELTFVAFATYRMLPLLQQMFVASVRMRADQPALTVIARDLRRRDEYRDAEPPVSQESRLRPFAAAAVLPVDALEQELRLENVTFRYAPDQPPVLDDLSLRVPARTTVGLVGANGSGKTTLMDLMAGLLVPAAGRVVVDGTELTAANRAAWQSRIAYVAQDFSIWDASVAANIAFGVPAHAIDRERLAKAAHLAQLDEFIASLPDGYEHVVGERGVRLSGGQRQRIGIARALYRQAKVLLLDEATSGLDGMTEVELMAALEGLRGSCTIVLIAHRPGMVRWCDVVFQLDRGRLADFGHFDELAIRSERFRQMTGGS